MSKATRSVCACVSCNISHALVGKQAEVLNILLEDLLEGHAVSETKLKEVLGHTPIQVHMLYCLFSTSAIDPYSHFAVGEVTQL